MLRAANVTIHASQFPENIRRDLLESFRTRRVNHKFHYDSVMQANRWLALHQAYSPSRNDPDCAATYDAAILAASTHIQVSAVHVLGLGCGGGQKDKRLLEFLHHHEKKTSYSPCDVSRAMVQVAQQTTSTLVAPQDCFPFVFDLATAADLPSFLDSHHAPQTQRIVTFLGMIPNFEPEDILPKLAALVRADDWLLFSANLAPGVDYASGLDRVLPQYDNPLTRDWLVTFLTERAVELGDGGMRFVIESHSGGLKKIVARFHFARPRRIDVEGETFEFRAGENIQLFFSYRYTPALVRRWLTTHAIKVEAQWITKSEEEGVFLCRRA